MNQTDAVVMKNFEAHKGPRDKNLDQLVRRKMGQVWSQKYQPLLDKEIEEMAKEKQGQDEAEIIKAQNEIIDKWDAEATKVNSTHTTTCQLCDGVEH